jgi:hypothetical protein
MVAAVQLSPADASRISLLFKGDRSIFTLADATRTSLAELLQWLALPHIQAILECLTRLEADAHRAAAITALRQTLDKSEDLVEKRRAACAILRALNSRPARITPVGVSPERQVIAPPRSNTPSAASAAPPPAAPPADRTPAPAARPNPAASELRRVPASSTPPRDSRSPAQHIPFSRSKAARLAQAARGTPGSPFGGLDLLAPVTFVNDSS